MNQQTHPTINGYNIGGHTYATCVFNNQAIFGVVVGEVFNVATLVAFPRSIAKDGNCMILSLVNGTYVNLDNPTYVSEDKDQIDIGLFQIQSAVHASDLLSSNHYRKCVWADDTSNLRYFLNTN